jgi:NAD(P)-dependent dehydrogenase (short-subunit alcohol dehydrogenase family)
LNVSEERFTRHWREHALGGFQLAQAAIPVLVQHGGGSLFFTGASANLRGKANFAPFASAKAAVRNLAQSIAREYGPKNIHVGHVVVDGGIEGDRLLSRAPHLLEQRGPDGMLYPDAIAEAYWDMPAPASRAHRPTLEDGCGPDGDPPQQSSRARQYPRN